MELTSIFLEYVNISSSETAPLIVPLTTHQLQVLEYIIPQFYIIGYLRRWTLHRFFVCLWFLFHLLDYA